jgi:hypothetical protein
MLENIDKPIDSERAGEKALDRRGEIPERHFIIII